MMLNTLLIQRRFSIYQKNVKNRTLQTSARVIYGSKVNILSFIYFRQYYTIIDDDQRYKYKQAFNEEYEEYRNLHSSIDLVSKKFCEMQELRRKTQKGTTEFQVILLLNISFAV